MLGEKGEQRTYQKFNLSIKGEIMKRNKNNLRYGHEYIECPICHHNTFNYVSYSEYEQGDS